MFNGRFSHRDVPLSVTVMPAAIPPIPKKELEAAFHLSLTSAAQHFCVSETFMKKTCRSYGIMRWPFRKVST